MDFLRRYLTSAGDYPYHCAISTPIGTIAPTTYSSHDVRTVNEVFARRTYAARRDVRVVVDVGANIGVSALYFLTRNHHVRVHAFEPVPVNLERLAGNTAPFRERCTIHPFAVALENGQVSFGTEPTGRYGGIGVEGELIEVTCRSINEVLDEILRTEDRIDILKVDIEGLEEAVVAGIAPSLLDRVEVIYYETTGPRPFHADRFAHRYELQSNRLTRRRRSFERDEHDDQATTSHR
ncbi:FkbM family methyltransferase [Actinomycetospora succinea]|uniref:FkbM family methyltransferase n=1 Tax=Actinomycetospora succinea TaxID=663603 RepID=UPI0014151135|nr:FkbM family methyltransferase [Actinomycetospora succinea]